jgi:hypothetical protein
MSGPRSRSWWRGLGKKNTVEESHVVGMKDPWTSTFRRRSRYAHLDLGERQHVVHLLPLHKQ